MKWLVCPLCLGDLGVVDEGRKLIYSTQGAAVADEEVTFGALTCAGCRVYYPIWDGVPRMLTYPTAVAYEHAHAASPWLDDRLKGLSLPNRTPPLGEERILRNFSTEWLGYRWTGKAYWNISPAQTLIGKRFELGIAPGDLRDKQVLEVGIGIGGTADALARTEGCEIIGMDLGYAVDQAQHYFGSNSRLHIVQGSVFAPPFRTGAFDMVYAHGVLHHTYSTRAAFANLAPLPKSSGGILYVWVYSDAQEKATPMRRALMAIEKVARPIVSRLPTTVQTVVLLPAVPAYILYQNSYASRTPGTVSMTRYGWNEALHAARDRLTPPFAFRHSYEEVMEWFAAYGYSQLRQLRHETLPPEVPPTYALNVGVGGRRGPGPSHSYR
jgi:uncharacterized protein YbaR (Trm112 family)/SAM-dependent methyltransferase